jgi:hypothetical protein
MALCFMRQHNIVYKKSNVKGKSEVEIKLSFDITEQIHSQKKPNHSFSAKKYEN